MFNQVGIGVAFKNDDAGGGTLQSTITDQFVGGNGLYMLVVPSYDNDPTLCDRTLDLQWIDWLGVGTDFGSSEAVRLAVGY